MFVPEALSRGSLNYTCFSCFDMHHSYLKVRVRFCSCLRAVLLPTQRVCLGSIISWKIKKN